MNNAEISRGSVRVANTLDSLTFYYNLTYLGLFAWALYTIFADVQPTAVSEVLGDGWYRVWIALHLLAAPAVWLAQLVPNRRFQWWLRWAGDSALVGIVTTHLIALNKQVDRDVVGAQYLVVFQAALLLAALCLATRDLLKALQASDVCSK